MTTRGARTIAFAGMAAVLACLASAAEAQRNGAGRGGVVVTTSGSFRGAPPVAHRGAVWVGGTHGTAWRGGAWGGNVWVGGGRPPAWGWRPGWGGWGWRPGWGGWWGPGWAGWGPGWSTPGWGWGPGWGWSVTAPIVVAPSVVTGAWVLPPSATVYIERSTEVTDGTAPAAPVAPAAPAAPPAQQWWYWCNSARAYYPYVNSCPEPWQRVEPQVPPGMQ